MTEAALDNPILNSPFGPPERHFEIGPNGPTGKVLTGRRPSESFIPIPAPRKGKGKAGAVQDAFDFDVTGERREANSLINDIRHRVELWRANNYGGVTAMSRKLLLHWSAGPPVREDPVLFCQREAAETAIYLGEVAGRRGEPDFRRRIDAENVLHNDGLPRIALKMATGSGKTVVMAMLIAWQTVNKVANPRDARFAKRFLVVTPGITIRDRLAVLDPAAPDNYYRQRDLVPPDLWAHVREAQVVITNYHAFLPRDAPEIRGVAANTRRILTAGKDADPFRETDDQIVSRVLKPFTGRGALRNDLVILSDEAHHCYQDKPLEDPSEADKEARDRNADARVWFKGIAMVARRVGVKAVYDLSATPYYLKGSGYAEGYIFPWTVSDFSLMDAIESGIVKVPRVPVDDDAAGDLVSYLRLWDHVGDKLPKRKLKPEADADWVPPDALEGALRSLYRSYERAFGRYEGTLAALGEPPPVFIVVCPNTTVSKLVYDWIAGTEVTRPDGSAVLRPGALPLLSNVVDGRWADRPPTVLIDSAALESGELLSADFKKAAAGEIEAFKAEYRRRLPGADVEKITDEDLLREVMNTVGKRGRLGEQVRCVVSVSMLTEGWDANTVSHVLGIRRFGSQLLCEQVVGRGLRRRSYATNAEGRFEPEYAEVYGVPFAFIPTERPVTDPLPAKPAVLVRALPEREHLEIRFPKLEGYRIEIPDERLFEDFSVDARLHVERNEVATWVQLEGVVGEDEEVDLDQYRDARTQEVAYDIAATLVHRFLTKHEAAVRPWLFPQLVRITRRWLTDPARVTFDPDAFVGLLKLEGARHRAAEKLFGALRWQEGNRPEILRPMIRRFDPEGTTATVEFVTRKNVVPTEKSHLSHVVLDGPKGNSWEEKVAELLEADERVASYVKNDHLDFRIPYVYEGRTHDYLPDFLVRLAADTDGVERTLVVEVSGGRKAPGPRAVKAGTARNQWCAAVNNHGGWGLWGYVELADRERFYPDLVEAMENLYADGPVTGLVEAS